MTHGKPLLRIVQDKCQCDFYESHPCVNPCVRLDQKKVLCSGCQAGCSLLFFPDFYAHCHVGNFQFRFSFTPLIEDSP